MELKFKLLDRFGKQPTYATDGSAAFDLYASSVNDDHYEPSDLLPGHPLLCGTSLAVEIPPGYGMFILSRSGHGIMHDTRLANCVGLIDSDYRGEIMVKLTADGADDETCNMVVFPGDRIAQAVILPVTRWSFRQVEALSDTARGAGGFGSTGR